MPAPFIAIAAAALPVVMELLKGSDPQPIPNAPGAGAGQQQFTPSASQQAGGSDQESLSGVIGEAAGADAQAASAARAIPAPAPAPETNLSEAAGSGQAAQTASTIGQAAQLGLMLGDALQGPPAPPPPPLPGMGAQQQQFVPSALQQQRLRTILG